MEKKRETSFDILRVIAMIMVIIIHVSNVYSRSFGIISNKSYFISLCFNTISRISVPIFLMISGALLLNREFEWKSYSKRIIKYLLLILVWDSIYLIWEYFYLGITYDKLYKLLLNPYRAHLWFLYTIIVLYAVQPLLRKILLKIGKNIKIILLLLWLSIFSISMLNTTLASILTIFSYIGYFIIGKYLYDYFKEKNLKKYNILFIIIILLSSSLSILLNYLFSIKHQMFYNFFFAYRTPFIIASSISFYLFVLSNYKKDTCSKLINILSNCSLGVYLIHGIFLDITVSKFVYQNHNSLIGIPFFSFLILISSVISVYLLKKIKGIKNLL